MGKTNFLAFNLPERRGVLVLMSFSLIYSTIGLYTIRFNPNKLVDVSHLILPIDTLPCTASPPLPFNFDPNNVSKKQLTQLGFKPFAIHNLLKYREKGGQFKNATDLMRIYGIDSADFVRLQPFISISPARNTVYSTSKSNIPHASKKSMPPPPLVIDINQATKEDWQKLKGIGPVLSARIVKFRTKLGGFYQKEQIAETYGISDSLYQTIQSFLKTSAVSPSLRINAISLKALASHPYIDWKLARIVVNYRLNHGPIPLETDWSFIPPTLRAPMKKVAPYLDFTVPD